jgi:hypothetical protein
MIFLAKRAIVLGAGASCSYVDSPTGQGPPLANQIIPTYFTLNISENRYVRVGDIVNYVKERRGIKAEDFPTWNEDIEGFLTEIDEEIVKLIPKLKSKNPNRSIFLRAIHLQRVYNQFIFLFASVFNDIQNGPVSIPYVLLANELGENDTCITFNWDTLFDRALASTGKWSPVNGYAIQPEGIFDDGWQSPDTFVRLTGGPQYIKLHGSTNWLTPYDFVDVSTGKRRTLSRYAINKFYVFLRAKKPYKTYENRYWGPYEPYSYCYYPPDLPGQRDDVPQDHVGISFVVAPDLTEQAKVIIDDKTVYSMPLIVPPVRDKRFQRYGNIFSFLWEKAALALSECVELFIIGYSFPRTDHVSRDLFKSALRLNKHLKKIFIWNPHPEPLRDLFINDFGIENNLLYLRKEKFNPLKCPTSTILSA